MSSPSDIGPGTLKNFKVGGSNLEFGSQPENLTNGKDFPSATPAGVGHPRKATTGTVVLRIMGKKGVAKTSSLSDLIKTLPPIVFLPLDSDDNTPEPEVRS